MRIGIIGTGNMGTVITQSLIESHAVLPEDVYITNRTLSKALLLQNQYPALHVLDNADAVIKHVDIIFICIKPLDIHPLLKKVNHLLTEDQCLVSITSPITTEQLEQLCPCSCIRAIPSITNRAFSGVCLLSYGKNCRFEWKEYVTNLLTHIGKPVEIDNHITRVASDIVSCGPAFFSFLMQKFIQSAVHETEITEKVATQLTSDMLIGMAALLEKEHYTLPTLQEKVCVKGGITGEGINILENSHIEDIFNHLFKATHNKYRGELKKIAEQYQLHGS